MLQLRLMKMVKLVKTEYKPAFEQLLDEVVSDINNGKNVNMVYTGAPRMGKSITMESFVYAYSKRTKRKYSISGVVWDIEPFVQIYNDANDGDAVRFDEAGVGISNRDWYEKKNKKLLVILQTMGFKHLLFCVTSPSFSYIDSAARKLFHHHIDVIARKKDFVVIKWRKLSYNSQTGKIYYKRPIVYDKNGTPYMLNTLKLYAPPKTVIEEYKKASEQWKRDMGEEISRIMKEDNGQDVDEEATAKKVLEMKSYFIKTRANKPYVAVESIENHFKVSNRSARRIKSLVEQKLSHTSNI